MATDATSSAPAATSPAPAAPSATPATAADNLKNANKHGIHHALSGPHTPKVGNHEAVAQHLVNLVERTKTTHEAHVGLSDLAGVNIQDDGQQTRMDRLSAYFKSLGCNILPNSKQLDDDFVCWKMGVYVAKRNEKPPNDKVFEDMPMYVRVGMHLLFYSSKSHSLLRYGSVEALLKRMSEHEGQIYDDSSKPEDVQAFIKNFIKTYSIELEDLEEQDLTKYKTRNEFFYRKLKPNVRPIADPSNPFVIGSAADCRLIVFDNVDEAKRIWIKGKQFSVKELINKHGNYANDIPENSSIAIFRLAPQDYHRYHHPIGPVKIVSQIHAGQEYYTVNPDAVNENFDVFTGNTRDVTMLEWSPLTGDKVTASASKSIKIAFCSIGALLVGSNVFTNAEQGREYKRGDEMGYYRYGGSTCIAVFPPEAKIRWDDDVKANSVNGIETLVKVNEKIGISEIASSASQ